MSAQNKHCQFAQETRGGKGEESLWVSQNILFCVRFNKTLSKNLFLRDSFQICHLAILRRFSVEETEMKQIFLKRNFPFFVVLFIQNSLPNPTEFINIFGQPEIILWSISFLMEEGCLILL